MPTANQYGIDLQNILSTASSIKTARLSQEKKQRDLDQQEAQVMGTYNSFAKRKAKTNTKPIKNALNTTSNNPKETPQEFKEEEVEQPTLKEAQQFISQSRQDEIFAKQDKENAEKAARLESVTNMYLAHNPSLSKEDARNMALVDAKQLNEIQEYFKKGDDLRRENTQRSIKENGDFYFSLQGMPPIEAEKAFKAKKQKVVDSNTKLLEAISQEEDQAKKQAMITEYNNMKQKLDQMPESVLNADGQTLNQSLITSKLASITHALKTTEDIVKDEQTERANKVAKDVAKQKAKDAIRLEGQKNRNRTNEEKLMQEGRIELEKLKQEGNLSEQQLINEGKKITEKLKGENSNTSNDKKLKTNLSVSKHMNRLVNQIFKGEFDQSGNFILNNSEDKRTAEAIYSSAYENWLNDGRQHNYVDYVTRAKIEYGIKPNEKEKERIVDTQDPSNNKNTVSNSKQEAYKKSGSLFRENGKVYKYINGKKTEMRKKVR